jgi:hypothetical protein
MNNAIHLSAPITPVISIELTEDEARALQAIFMYSVTDFKRFFYQNLGTSCLKPHEKGLDSLAEKSKELSSVFKKIDQMRLAVKE